MSQTARLLLDCQCQLGEGPIWHPGRQQLFFFDINEQTLFAVTATGESIGAARAHSALQAWAIGLKDAFEQAYVFTAEWLGEEANVEVTVSTDFSVVPFAQAPLTALKDARTAKDISQRTYWDGLRRFDVLPQDFDPEAEEGKLAEELEGLEPEEAIDPRGGREGTARGMEDSEGAR